MKNLSLTLLVLLMLGGTTQAQDTKTQFLNAKQVAKLDVTGKWSGKRQQYSWDHKTIVETFQYEFNLKQEGSIVTGTSTIMNSNGDYADMLIEGIIIGNKLHFAEKEVKNAIRPEGRVWCFKSGELNFTKEGDNLKLNGATPSYMEGYNLPCSGGITDLSKVDNSTNDMSSIMGPNTTETSTGTAPDINITAYPNPFAQTTSIQYNLTADAKVQVDIFNISGQLVTTLFSGNQKAASGYKVDFNANGNAQNTGVYIVKMTINGEVYSRQLVQML